MFAEITSPDSTRFQIHDKYKPSLVFRFFT
uniref:Uncharacterized protein n=1 Tax=Anguilla anguilla TaxID=7936 RepID=A0A0E9XX20_ANGAN